MMSDRQIVIFLHTLKGWTLDYPWNIEQVPTCRIKAYGTVPKTNLYIGIEYYDELIQVVSPYGRLQARRWGIDIYKISGTNYNPNDYIYSRTARSFPKLMGELYKQKDAFLPYPELIAFLRM